MRERRRREVFEKAEKEEEREKAVFARLVEYYEASLVAACLFVSIVTPDLIHTFRAYIYDLIRARHALGKTQPKTADFSVTQKIGQCVS